MKKLISFILLIITVEFVNAQVKVIKMAEAKRRYLIYLPKGYQENHQKKFEVVFNFHGGGMTSAEQMLYTGMNKTADKHGFIAVYPSGISQEWNVGFGMSYKNGTNDIGFVKAILDSLSKDHRIDKNAIYACGLSRGGFFTQRIASEMPDAFAAVASISGPLPDSVKHFHQSKNKISVMMIHGTEDNIVKYEGKASAYSSAKETFDFWVRHNQLNSNEIKQVKIDQNPKDGTQIDMLEIKENGVSVSLISITGGGHTWPGSDPYNVGLPLGKTTQEIDINEVMWAFFKKNRKK